MHKNLSKYLHATLQDEPTKLLLSQGDEKTKDFLMVLGSESPRLKRAFAVYGYELNKAQEELKSESMSVEKVLKSTEATVWIDRYLAVEMVTGWSFGEFSKSDLTELLTQNKQLVKAIHARSFDAGQYTSGK